MVFGDGDTRAHTHGEGSCPGHCAGHGSLPPQPSRHPLRHNEAAVLLAEGPRLRPGCPLPGAAHCHRHGRRAARAPGGVLAVCGRAGPEPSGPGGQPTHWGHCRGHFQGPPRPAEETRRSCPAEWAACRPWWPPVFLTQKRYTGPPPAPKLTPPAPDTHRAPGATLRPHMTSPTSALRDRCKTGNSGTER